MKVVHLDIQGAWDNVMKYHSLACGRNADRASWGSSVAVPKAYPKADSTSEHCVAVVGVWAIDLTARQFDPTLPFPLLLEVA